MTLSRTPESSSKIPGSALEGEVISNSHFHQAYDSHVPAEDGNLCSDGSELVFSRDAMSSAMNYLRLPSRVESKRCVYDLVQCLMYKRLPDMRSIELV